MFNLSDQLTGSFEELMEELRWIRGELAAIRRQLAGSGTSLPRAKSTPAARAKGSDRALRPVPPPARPPRRGATDIPA